MNLELTNTMPFGRHKGKTIEEIYKDNASYLVWLRAERKKEQGDEKFFSPEVSALLDMTIEGDKRLKRDYKPWNLPIDTGVRTEPVPKERPPEVNYGGVWGGF